VKIVPTDERYREAAQAEYQQPDKVEVDENAPVKRMPDGEGAWVQAWVYISAEDAAE